jgi:transcriptional regulator with XRE-family HTH domain
MNNSWYSRNGTELMLTTGNQLRAARALAGMDQGTLAARAKVNINTIGAMEKLGANGLKSGLDTIRAVMDVLEAEGIEFLNHGHPGVRLNKTVTGIDAQIAAATERADKPIPAGASPESGMAKLRRGKAQVDLRNLKAEKNGE